MTDWRRDAEMWLEREGQDDKAAEVAFGQMCAALPPVEPSPGFAARTAAAAWSARARRRRLAAAAYAAAVASVAGAAALVVAFGAPGWLLLTGARIAASALMTLLLSAATLAEVWTSMAGGGTAVARVLVMPQGVAALVTVELVGAAALYALHRLLRDDVRFRNTGPLCI